MAYVRVMPSFRAAKAGCHAACGRLAAETARKMLTTSESGQGCMEEGARSTELKGRRAAAEQAIKKQKWNKVKK